MARVFGEKNSYLKSRRVRNGSSGFYLSGQKGGLDNYAGNARVGVVSVASLVLIIFFLSGFIYLYQVNDLATKGFEIKEIENKIQSLEENGKKLKIKETELKSMHTIERDVEGLNLVSSKDVSYVEINGPIALK